MTGKRSGDREDLDLDVRSNTSQPAVMETIRRLRADSQASDEGAMIGSEEDLISRYGISRPTLRQAAVIVAQEQLVRIRRGVGGGYIATRPHFSAVANMAAVFLQTKGTDLREILSAVEPIRIELVRLATLNADDAARADLKAFLEIDEARRVEGYSFRYFLWAERRYAELLGQASRSTVLTLFLEILLDLVATLPRDKDLFISQGDRIAEGSAGRNRVIRAIIAGDVEIAALEARRTASRSTEWLLSDRDDGAERVRAYDTALADARRARS